MSKKYIMDEMSNLPPRYYQRPNSLPRFLLSLLTLSIVLGALPVSVYLVGQRTAVLPQAAPAKVERVGTVSLSLEQDPNFATNSAQLTVDLLVHSDEQAANLFATRVSFNSQNLELAKVATNSAQLTVDAKKINSKWIEAKVDNQIGQVDLIAGVPNPGIKTDPNQRYILAKLIFNLKKDGVGTFHLDPDSTIFSNATNQPLTVRKNDLTLNLPVVNLPSPTSTTISQAKFILFKNQASSLFLISPIGGETVGFNSNSRIQWQSSGLNQVVLNLLINGEKLGQIASVSASLGKLDWKPANYILPTFLTPTNTYQIEIEGQDASGQLLSATSVGPFAIIPGDSSLEASQAANLASRGGDANHDGKVDLTDLSILLSSYGKKDNLDLGVDLNGDGVVNDVDLFLFKQVLLK